MIGSIPACAGEPALSTLILLSHGVYPRVCGGALLQLCLVKWLVGLSPRVRGSLTIRRDAQTVPGSIPACAGEPY